MHSQILGGPETGTPGVSVIIPAYNEENSISRCLDALFTQSVPPLEIIVVDNMSTDRTRERVKERQIENPQIRLVRQHRVQGLIPTRNAGFNLATGSIIARIDADTIVRNDWIKQITSHFDDPRIAALTGPVGYYDLPLLPVNRRIDDWGRRFVMALSRRNSFLFGANMALRNTAWMAIRKDVCSDIDDLFHEDIDLAIHLNDNGLKIRYAPRMTATVSARSASRNAGEFREYTRRFERTLNAHGLRQIPLRLVGRILRALYPVLHRAQSVSSKSEA